MARGGGTGSRNKKKKDSAVPTNTVDKENLKTTSTNGGSQIDHSASDHLSNKQKNTKNRKQKEETPPHQPTIKEDDELKDDKQSKLVPTSEQLRLAQITQSQDATMDPMRKAKISQLMDITGKTEDEVATALFDSSWDETKAIELLLEEGGGLGSWEETGKKKKKKLQDEKENGKDNEDWNDDFDPNNQFDNRERSRNRGPPRLRNRGGQGQMGGQRGESDQWKNREFQENERNYDSGAGRGRGGRGMGPRSRGGANGAQRGHQRGRGAGGPRGYNSRGSEFGERTDQRPPMDTGGFGQIDTWNPMGNTSEGDQNRQQAPGQQLQQRHPKMNNSKDAFDNAGNWGDDFPAAEDWDNDEYTGSLTESKVFTPSGSSTAKSAVGEPVNGPVAPHPAAVGTSPGGPVAPVGSVGDTPPTAANNSLSGSSYSQPIDISALLQKPGGLAGGPTAAPGGPTASLSQYNQTATQDLKSAIGIGPGVKASSEQLAPGYGSSSLSYSSSSVAGNVAPGYTSTTSHPTSSFNSAAPGSAFSPIKPAAVTNGSSSGSKALPRARLPPPSKIPSSAVEMPGDSLSNLDVQFGGLDLQFGGSNNDSNSSTNFDFNAAPGPGGVTSTPPSQQAVKDSLEINKYAVHSIPSQVKPDPLSASVPGGSPLDSYKTPGVQAPGSNSVKDVNQSLSSALSAAGIKQSASSDNVPGFGRPESNSRPDSKSNTSGYGVSAVPGPQRSPGPLMTKAETLSYNGPSYSYPSANQSQVKASSNFAVSGYPSSASGYERQNSSGYSATNGLGSSYGTGSGGGSSGYSSNNTPVGNNSYSGNSGYNSAQSASNPGVNQFGSNSGYGTAATTNYSPYTSNNSYSSKSSTPSTSYNPVSTTASSSLSQYSETTNKTTTGPSSGYDTVSVSATGGTYGGSNSSALGLGGQGAQTATSSSKIGVNTTTGKIVPGMPPGVASVLPAQYMIGANTGGFPAYLAAAGLGQAPAMYGYGGHQLEDLAALQRSTLAASLPQLVGGAGGPVGSGGSGGPTSKGPSTAGYYDPSNQFGGGTGAPSTLASRQGADPAPSFGGDTSGKFGGVSDSTSSPVPSTVAATGQPTPFNALASTFAAAAPQQHPTLPPGYAYFYGGVGGMPGALQAAAYGGGVGAGVYPATHPGIPVNTAAGATNTTQFQKQAYGSSYGTSYDSLSLGQSNSGYGQKQNNYGQNDSQQAKSSSNSNAGLFQVTGPQMPSGKLINNLGGREPRYW